MARTELSRTRSTIGLIGGNHTKHMRAKHPDRDIYSWVRDCKMCEKQLDSYIYFCQQAKDLAGDPDAWVPDFEGSLSTP